MRSGWRRCRASATSRPSSSRSPTSLRASTQCTSKATRNIRLRTKSRSKSRLWSDAKPGIRRERSGTSFRYRSATGKPVSDAGTLARIRALAIPPAWAKVLICPDANGHLQAVGHDARGRKQYRYNPAFRAKRDGAKYDRVLAFGAEPDARVVGGGALDREELLG